MNSSEIKTILLMNLLIKSLRVAFFRTDENFEDLKQEIINLPEELYQEIKSFSQE